MAGHFSPAVQISPTSNRTPLGRFAELLLASTAEAVILPPQDWLGQGIDTRMNIPRTIHGDRLDRSGARESMARDPRFPIEPPANHSSILHSTGKANTP